MGALLSRLAVAIAVACIAIAVGAIAIADADSAGELGSFGEYGTADGELSNPQIFGAEPNGSVYVGDQPNEYQSFRIQKFSPTGTLEGAVTIPTPNEEVFEGIAVDPTKGRFYVLRDHEGGDGQTNRALAEAILVFSTTPNAARELVPPTGGPAVIPVPDGESPGGDDSIDDPTQLVLDPHDGDLEILGVDRAGHPVLQRIGTAGGGSVGPRYVELGDGDGLSSASGVAIGPDGTTYIVHLGRDPRGDSVGILSTLPPSLTGTPAEVPGFSELPGGAPVISTVSSGLPGYGPQIALSGDGEVLYYRRQPGSATGPFEPATVQIVGYSLAEGNVRQIYGDGTNGSECRVETAYGSLATVESGVAVLDPGTPEFGPSPFAERVIRFGPGGTGCPAPSASLALETGSGKATTVPRNTTVALDASASAPGAGGESFEGATWTIEGPEGRIVETIAATSAADLVLDHTFVNPGSYTVRLAVKVKLTKEARERGPGGQPTVYSSHPQSLVVTGGGGTPPTITGLNPVTGPAAGENTVTISGTRFTGTPTVRFGAAAAANVKVVDANTVTVTAPAGTAGRSVDVTVTTADGITPRTAADRYVYENGGGSGPGGGGGTVTGVSPAGGPAAGGNVVTIFGNGLDGVDRVKFGNVEAAEVTDVDASTVTAKVPPGVQGSTVHVIVVNSSGAASAPGPADTYRYDPLMQGLGVVKVGTGTGTVASAGAGISCGSECVAAFPQGATVVLNASAASGSTFAGWGGACSGQGSCVVGMTATKGVVANFEAGKPPPAARAAPVSPPATKPSPKKLKCKKGAKRKKVDGKPKCVAPKPKKRPTKHRGKKHRKHEDRPGRPSHHSDRRGR